MGLWGGRFKEGLDEAMVPLNRSLDVDWRLWRHDIAGSRAWARALVDAGVLTGDEGEAIDAGLDEVGVRLSQAPGPRAFDDEDIHSLVERLLTDAAGPVGGKLHTGRSRNDQVATDFRLWGMATVQRMVVELEGMIRILADRARASMDVAMPAYTHLQQAQPTSAAHWLLSRAWPLVRDRDLVLAVGRECSVLPLGSGAVAGCPFPIDREALASALGFEAVSRNSTDAVSDRDWCAHLLFAAAMVGVHLSQLAEDLVLFSSREFGFVRLGDGFTTGSSLMPQKKNPDVAELVRGKSGRLVGNLVGMLTILKGLPTGYNRDLQEDKEAVFDSVDTLFMVLPALSGAAHGLTFERDRLAEVLGAELLATDLADYLVDKGVPFRESHHVIGRLVQLAEDSGRSISDLTLEEMRDAHPGFGSDAPGVFDVDRSLQSRRAIGGTARSAIEDQLDALEDRLPPRR